MEVKDWQRTESDIAAGLAYLRSDDDSLEEVPTVSQDYQLFSSSALLFLQGSLFFKCSNFEVPAPFSKADPQYTLFLSQETIFKETSES